MERPKLTMICNTPVTIRRPATAAERMFQQRTGKRSLLQGFDFRRGPTVLTKWLAERLVKKVRQ